MMNEWLDDLSEDWPSQPPSLNASIRSRTLASSTNTKIPRIRGAASKPSTTNRKFLPARNASGRRSALSERSLSEDNIQPPTRRPAKSRLGSSQRSHSADSSSNSIMYATVEHKSVTPSPKKSGGFDETPEWRRRLLMGEMGYADQKDLFAAKGIENIFQKPPPQDSEPEPKRRGLSFLKHLDHIPSSPPWPTSGAQSFVSIGQTRGNTMRSLHPVEEIEERSRQTSQATEPDAKTAEDNDAADAGSESNKGSVLGPMVPPKQRVRSTGTVRSTSRTASGNSHSDSFSAVFISKHNTADGRVDYKPLDLSRSELAEQLEQMGMSNHSHQVRRSASGQFQVERLSHNADDASLSALREEEDLPEDLPAGTPELNLGEFVTVKRGGYSDDGSFRRRPLSPSPLRRPSSSMMGESLLRNTEIPPNASQLYIQPNSRLLSVPESDEPTRRTMTSGSGQSTQRSKVSEATTAIRREISEETESLPQAEYQHQERELSISSRFGEGQLDQHEFPEDFSSLSIDSSLDPNDLPTRSPSPDVMPPGSQQPFRFRVEPAAEVLDNDTFKHQRKLSKISAKSTLSVTKRNSAKRDLGARFKAEKKAQEEVEQAEVAYESKRPPPSPFKDPTPKRRRTLLSVDMSESQADRTASVRESHERVQQALNKKRKDARFGGPMNRADPDVLARRHILRPRNPTPSQRRQQEIEIEVLEATEAYLSSSPQMRSIREHLQVPAPPNTKLETAQAQAIATEIAAFSERAIEMHDDSRKRSVTTQDFLDEAMRIMSMIRNKPPVGLEQVQESNLENEDQTDASGTADFPSDLTLSRPASREDGRSGWRTRQNQVDPGMLDHLAKFQEKDDDRYIASSIGSRFGHPVEQPSSRIPTVQSDPPGVHIIAQSAHLRSQSHTTEMPKSTSTRGSTGTGHKSHSTNTSIDSTMARTTGSRKSDTVAKLAPEAVAHLIPEEVAGMSFDKEKGIWVKSKSPRKVSIPQEETESEVTQSDDDPFGNIPDLTYDEDEEQKHLSPPKDGPQMAHTITRAALLQRHQERDVTPVAPAETSAHDHYVPPRTPPRSRMDHHESLSTPPRTRTDRNEPEDDGETGREPKAHAEFEQSKRSVDSHATSSFESVEHEFTIDEGRNHNDHNTTGVRKITVSLPTEFSARVHPPTLSGPPQEPRRRTVSGLLNTPRPSNLPAPLGSSPLPPVDELQEFSIQGQSAAPRRVNFSLSLSHAPPNPLEASSSPSRTYHTFCLSDMSDFTVHQTDERERVERDVVKSSTKIVEDRYAQGNNALVKALQETEAQETYWEDLRAIDLSGRGLTSVHLLDTLCDRLEKADLSDNQITQLSGAPSTLRSLDLHKNLLSSMTWWGHLTNLQYLDVSGNDIDNLTGFGCLVHLRELRADDNKITSLDGLHSMDGLLKLSLRNNKISGMVDFEGFDLSRLELLDLGKNEITAVESLEWLPALSDLKLDSNRLVEFPAEEQQQCPRLSSLDLSRNQLEHFHADSLFPALQHLILDYNFLDSKTDLSSLKGLSALSLRNQVSTDKHHHSLPILPAMLKSLYLSLNPLHELPASMLTSIASLQHLELASCGLAALPENLGLAAPNLRSINLNFNALKDIRPLLNIKRLGSLFVAGNRLARLRKTAAVLAKLNCLEVLDVRDNPFTLGFYDAQPTLDPPTRAEVVRKEVPQRDASSSILQVAQDPPSAHAQPDFAITALQAAPFSLPWSCDRTADTSYAARLDPDTALRRRVYSVLLASSCRHIRFVNGLPFVRNEALQKDDVWERLVALGVLRRSERAVLVGAEQVGVELMMSEVGRVRG